MCVDLTDELDPYQLAYVIYRAEYWHIFNLAATEAAMARAKGRHNLHVLERAPSSSMRAVPAGTRSAKEDAFRRAQANEPLVNVKVDGIEVDFHWPVVNGASSKSTAQPHRRRATKLDDARRDEPLHLARAGAVTRTQDLDRPKHRHRQHRDEPEPHEQREAELPVVPEAVSRPIGLESAVPRP